MKFLKFIQTLGIIFVLWTGQAVAASVSIQLDPSATPREKYGASRLETAFSASGFRVPARARVIAGVYGSSVFAKYSKLPQFTAGETEAFHLTRSGNDWLVVGRDPSGVLYGCMELARRAAEVKTLPATLDVSDHPALRIRGTNLFWMKRGDYNWAVVPKEFPWFFDKELMTRYLDELAENRYNTIFFWNGHPFPYFLKLAKYPEAQMLGDADLERNIAYFKWFTEEADRRGLWTVFHFYNIHVSPNFAKAHAMEGVKEENGESTPLLAAYTRYCISEFVNSYPSVGLMLTAGEALYIKSEEFVRDTIIAGIKDTGKHPPLIVRQWAIDPYRYRDVIKGNYDNLYTMMKHNTEMIVSPEPDPRNKTWISFGQSHIMNMHELGDVKPFRWGSPVWIQQMVGNWKSIGANGFHLYPMTSWMWPEALDQANPPLSVIDRDRIWIEAFGRYGWNPDRPATGEEKFWGRQLAKKFGTPVAGKAIYNYYVKTGPILPGMQNVVNVFNMNYHPTAVSQEATLNGILHSERWEFVGDYLARPLDEFTLQRYEQRFGKLSPDARRRPPLSVKEYLQPHPEAVDPLKLADLFVTFAEESLAGLEAAQPQATKENEEYARFLNDNRCVLHFARFYRAKLEAAIEKGSYDATGDTAHYDAMLAKTDVSVEEYRALTKLAQSAYRQATDLGDYYRWDTTLSSFEQEAAFYHEQKDLAAKGGNIVYIGLDGPMSNANNAFHWLMEYNRKQANWSAQSYHFGENPLRQAKLVVVYGLDSPQYQQHAAELQQWVKDGGKLVIWDDKSRASSDPLLAGIQFEGDSSHRLPYNLGFDGGDHSLLQGLAGVKYNVPSDCFITTSIHRTSPEWQELAYSVLESLTSGQFYSGYPTLGPRWTSLMDPARVPLVVTRKFGDGQVVLAQLGYCNIKPKRNVPSGKLDQAPEYFRKFTENLMTWSKEK